MSRRHSVMMKIGLTIFMWTILTPVAATVVRANYDDIHVNTFDDDYTDNGNCSLREAITAVNTQTTRDACVYHNPDDFHRILLQTGTYRITRGGNYENGNATGDFDITQEVELYGSSTGPTIIDGNDLDRVFHIQVGYSELVQMNRLIIQNGAVPVPESGGGIYMGNADENNDRTRLHMTRCVVRNNDAGFGGGIALYNAFLTMENCTVSGNNAWYSAWVLSGGSGGGIYRVESSSYVTISLYATTVTDNFADWGCSGIHSDRRYGHITLISSILAGNRYGIYGDHPDICGTTDDARYSFIGSTKNTSWYFADGEIMAFTPPDDFCDQAVTGNICDFDEELHNPNPSVLDPELLPLADNGGGTYTHAYAADSPVFHAGICRYPFTGLAYYHLSPDQRLINRGTYCSMGSYELSVAPGESCEGPALCDDNLCQNDVCCTPSCAYNLGGYCGPDGSCDCRTGWAGTLCNVCADNYYGGTCTACPVCVNGTCNDGISGDGQCACDHGFAGTLCDVCAEGFTGALCDTCAEGYYGPDCLPCPACVNGSCNEGISGDGQCACDHGFSGELCDTCADGFTGDLCDACDTGYFGPDCLSCPLCEHGLCLDGITGSGDCECAPGWTGELCTTCDAGYYGQLCDACPACLNGVCDDGPDGSGMCICTQGWTGSLCDACGTGYFGDTCAACPVCAHGTCNEGTAGDGLCACETGWAGEFCDACAGGYYGDSCAACPVCEHGTCNEGLAGDGLCACETGWDGELCDTCGDGYYGDNCAACPACEHGTCNEGIAGDGLCACETGWAGELCDACDTGYFGASCDACPACVNGTCNEGLAGDGMCACETGWDGELCDTCAEGFTGELCDACDTGYYGETCEACPVCVNGICNEGIAADGLCACETGWAGELCDACAEGFTGELCDVCDTGYYGETCAACPACVHGTCNEGIAADGLCACATGWGGELCDTCADHFSGDLCDQCAEGWSGDVCETPLCDPVCHEFATCTAPDTCVCNQGYTGDGYSCETENPCADQPDWIPCDDGACFAETCEVLGAYDRCSDAGAVILDTEVTGDMTGYHSWRSVEDTCLAGGIEGLDAYYLFNAEPAANIDIDLQPDAGVDVAVVLYDACGDDAVCLAAADEGGEGEAETLSLPDATSVIIQVILSGEPSGETRGYSLLVSETVVPDGDPDVDAIDDVDDVDIVDGVDADTVADGDAVDKDATDSDADPTENADVIVDGDVTDTAPDGDPDSTVSGGGSDDGCSGGGSVAAFMLLLGILGFARRKRRAPQG